MEKKLLSEEDVRNLLNFDYYDNDFPMEITTGIKQFEILSFLYSGKAMKEPTMNYSTENISDLQLIEIAKSIDVNQLLLPQEDESTCGYLTKEKYSIIRDKLIEQFENGTKLDLDQIKSELGYFHLGGSITLENQ
jgi:hypothetical protein